MTETRLTEDEGRILQTLRQRPLSASVISALLTKWAGPVYVALAALERRDLVRSEWVDEPAPRRRAYAITPAGLDAISGKGG